MFPCIREVGSVSRSSKQWSDVIGILCCPEGQYPCHEDQVPQGRPLPGSFHPPVCLSPDSASGLWGARLSARLAALAARPLQLHFEEGFFLARCPGGLVGSPTGVLVSGATSSPPRGWGRSGGSVRVGLVPGCAGWESLVEVPAQGKAGVQGSPRAEAWCCRSSSSQGGSQGPGKAFPGLDPFFHLCLAPSSYWAGLGLEPKQLCPFYTVSVASSAASAGEGPFCGASGRFLSEFRDAWLLPACVLGGGCHSGLLFCHLPRPLGNQSLSN